MDEKNKIRCRAIIEVLGKPKEHVEKALKTYIQKIKEDSNIAILKESYSEPKQIETMWGIFIELDMVAKGIETLIGFCFDYMPSSIEIEKPEQLAMRSNDMSNFINDLIARLHKVDMTIKKQKGEMDLLKKNLNTAIKNIILLSLKVNSQSEERLAKTIGIEAEYIKPFIDDLVKDNKIKKENNTYSLI